jgi:hypothetical protein
MVIILKLDLSIYMYSGAIILIMYDLLSEGGFLRQLEQGLDEIVVSRSDLNPAPIDALKDGRFTSNP